MNERGVKHPSNGLACEAAATEQLAPRTSQGAPATLRAISEAEARNAERAAEALTELRRHVDSLLAQIDTARLPAGEPERDEVEYKLGTRWRPAHRWTVRTITYPESRDCVYVETPETYPSGDMVSLSIADARRLAMALLAAADEAAHRIEFGPQRATP